MRCYVVIIKKNELGFYLEVWDGGYVIILLNLEGMGVGLGCWGI